MRCLIVDKIHECLVSILEAKQVTVDYLPGITRSEILSKLGEYEGLIIRSKTTVDEELLGYGLNLKFVARAGAGVDNIDEEATRSRGIKVISAPEGNRDALAEHTVGMLLSLLHKIHFADASIRNMNWNREGNRGTELKNKVVGIIGYGNMGQAFAKRLSGFDCEVLAYDKYKSKFSDQYASETTQETIFSRVDILSFHIPLTPENRQLVDHKYLEKVKKPFIIINTSRGEILSLKALKYYLGKNKIIGAALDVLENENFDELTDEEREIVEYLIKSDKTIITPHIAGWSFESYELISRVLAKKITDEFF